MSSCSPMENASIRRLHPPEFFVLRNRFSGRSGAVALVLACVLGFAPGQLRAQTISQVPYIVTVAGNGTPGCTGDGAPASSAELDAPGGILDRDGNLYISGGPLCNVMRVVNRQTVPVTVAGVTIQPGYIVTWNLSVCHCTCNPPPPA
jgi:hypothetical protein